MAEERGTRERERLLRRLATIAQVEREGAFSAHEMVRAFHEMRTLLLNAGIEPTDAPKERETMNLEQFGKACKETERLLTRDGVEPSVPMRVPDKPWVRAHLLWMLGQAVVYYTEKPEKANRWLGFVQGCMACHGYKLDALKRANMQDGTMFDPDRV